MVEKDFDLLLQSQSNKKRDIFSTLFLDKEKQD